MGLALAEVGAVAAWRNRHGGQNGDAGEVADTGAALKALCLALLGVFLVVFARPLERAIAFVALAAAFAAMLADLEGRYRRAVVRHAVARDAVGWADRSITIFVLRYVYGWTLKQIGQR